MTSFYVNDVMVLGCGDVGSGRLSAQRSELDDRAVGEAGQWFRSRHDATDGRLRKHTAQERLAHPQLERNHQRE